MIRMDSAFDIQTNGADRAGNTLIIGQTHVGMAGVTAADYLVRHLESTEMGKISPEDLPAIAPFEEGIPRHHSRLYDVDGQDIVILVNELFIPVGAARSYTNSIMEWVDEMGMSEIVVLHGVPFPHGPDEHDVFHVTTEDYRSRRLDDEEFKPLKGGFLDGVVGELITRSLDEQAPETGVFITPTHPPGPDIEAALKLIDALESIYGFTVDETELRELGEQLRQYYEQLAHRIAEIEGDESLPSHDYPEDRMYM